MTPIQSVAAGALAALALAGCAGGHKLSPPPITSLAALRCPAQPVLDAAPNVALDPAKPLTIEFTATAPCVEATAGAKSAYAAIRLPDSAEPYLVSVASAPQGGTLFSPRLILADGQGRPLRERDRSTFLFRGAVLQASFRAQPDEHFLIVASDPASVGQQISRITGNVMQSGVMVGTSFVPINAGAETSVLLTQAHNGVVTVTAGPLPKAQ
jgi:hypothetical protein